jgi:hypothetical protein
MRTEIFLKGIILFLELKKIPTIHSVVIKDKIRDIKKAKNKKEEVAWLWILVDKMTKDDPNVYLSVLKSYIHQYIQTKDTSYIYGFVHGLSIK